MTSLIRPQLLLIPLLLATGGLQAMTVTRSATPPQGGMLLARDVANDVGSYECSRGLGAEVQAGQTFRLATAVDLARITVRVRPMTDVAGKQLVLFFGTFSGPGDETMDELLATELGKLPATLPVGEITYLTFDIADRQLAAGQQYGFVFGFSGGDHPGEADLDVLHLGANGYADGTAVEWSGLQETALANDLVVFLQGTAESEDPPDPPDPPSVPYDTWIDSVGMPGFEAQVRITPAGGVATEGAAEIDCIDETICASGALPGRPEIFVKVIGPRPNGYFWVQLIRFTPSQVEVWLRQQSTGKVNEYVLPAVPGDGTLMGLEDRVAFEP